MALPVRVHRDKTGPARWDGFAELRRLADGPDGFLAPQIGTELRETDDAYVVELAVPHMKKRDIDVSVAGRRLIIMGEHTQRSGILRRRTRRVEQLRYDVVLPGQVVEDGVRANLDGDVLTVTVPKVASERRRRIEVR